MTGAWGGTLSFPVHNILMLPLSLGGKILYLLFKAKGNHRNTTTKRDSKYANELDWLKHNTVLFLI